MQLNDAIAEAFRMLASGDAALWEIVLVSLQTTLTALLIATPFAIFAGYQVATRSFRGRRAVVWLGQAALSLPTVLIGLVLYTVLTRQGVFGQFQLLFTRSAIVIGQVLIVFPVLFAISLAAIQAIDPRLPETAITLGASRWRQMLTVLHEVRFGILAAIINGFGRIISEVGCAMMVGGNIAGETRTITTAITLQTSRGEIAQGIALGVVLITIALLINLVLMSVQGDMRMRGVAS